MRKIALKNIVWKEGKHYVSQCLNVDISSFGKTEKEAIKNLQEAVELYLEDAPKSEIMPVERPSIHHRSFQYA